MVGTNSSPIVNCRAGPGTTALVDSGPVPVAAVLAKHDIVVNCVLQHTDKPLMFVTGDSFLADPSKEFACSGWSSLVTAGWGPSRSVDRYCGTGATLS